MMYLEGDDQISSEASATGAAGVGASRISVARFFWANFRLMLGIIVSITGVTAAFSYLTPGTYSSTGVVLIERGKSPTFRSDPVRYELDAPEVINSEIGIVKSRAVAEAVIDRLGLEQRPGGTGRSARIRAFIENALDRSGLSVKLDRRAKLIKMLGKRLKVEQVPASSLLSITFQSPDPVAAAEVARAIMDASLERHREIYADTTAAFFEARFKETESLLNTLREAMAKETDPAGLQGLGMQRDALEKTYYFYRDRWDRARADAAGELSLVNVRAVDYPAVPSRPLHSRLFSILLALVASTILSIAVALVWDYFDHTVYAPGDVRANLDVPVLGSVPRIRFMRTLF